MTNENISQIYVTQKTVYLETIVVNDKKELKGTLNFFYKVYLAYHRTNLFHHPHPSQRRFTNPERTDNTSGPLTRRQRLVSHPSERQVYLPVIYILLKDR